MSHWSVRYLVAAAIVAVATLFRALVDPLIHDQIPYFIYVGSVVVSAWICGVGGGLLSMVLSGFIGNYLFVSPRYSWRPSAEDWTAMSLFWVVTSLLVWLVSRWRRAEQVLHHQTLELMTQGHAMRAQTERLQALHSEAERVNRVKDEFLATLSHELRTPLNAIVGWAHLMTTGNLSPEKQRTAAETILRNAKAQVRLVEDLLEVSRIISGKLHLQMALTDLVEVVMSAVDMVRNAASAKDIDLRCEMPDQAPIVGDADRLRQIAWNLVSNAVKFTGRGGRVEVRLERHDGQVSLTVSDTGVGIPREFLGRLFERFSQADSSTTRKHGGLGLGLAVARHLVELHGGSIQASSDGPGRGATFRVELPVRTHADGPPSGLPIETPGRRDGLAAADARVLDGLKVLVVDDEEDARTLVETVLARYGADVKSAVSATEAFSEVRRWRPDVLVADIGMPIEDGYSLLRRVRALPSAEGGQVPAAALTAYVQAGDRERVLAAGFQAHVPKPVSPDHLASVVAGLARGSAVP